MQHHIAEQQQRAWRLQALLELLDEADFDDKIAGVIPIAAKMAAELNEALDWIALTKALRDGQRIEQNRVQALEAAEEARP